mgnify:CR=1 FL=1
MEKKFKYMTLKERKAYWKSLPKERQQYFLAKIIELAKKIGERKEVKVYEPRISYEMTDREKRARGGWGNWTSH